MGKVLILGIFFISAVFIIIILSVQGETSDSREDISRNLTEIQAKALCREALNYGIKKVDIGVILGSGMDAISSKFNKIFSIPYDQIPHLVPTAIKSHKGELIYAEAGGKLLLIFAGRIR